MSFLIPCPNCGLRSSQEFRFGGEYHARPDPGVSEAEWAHYLYARKNVAGPQQEWWFHRFGCRKWFLAVRDTTNNAVLETFWPGTNRTADAPEPTEPAPSTEAVTG
jgi:heterotetrameric sarcosine oxidase delta subunit